MNFMNESRPNLNMRRFKNKNKGVFLIEVLVGASIMVAAMAAILGLYGSLSSLSLNNTSRIQAGMLLDEGAEALRLMRDSGWSKNIASLSNGTTYRLVWSGGTWTSTTSAYMIDGQFDRTFMLGPVYRDSTTYNIISSGGTLDTGTRAATVTVAWKDDLNKGATTTKSVQLYLYNTFSN